MTLAPSWATPARNCSITKINMLNYALPILENHAGTCWPVCIYTPLCRILFGPCGVLFSTKSPSLILTSGNTPLNDGNGLLECWIPTSSLCGWRMLSGMTNLGFRVYVWKRFYRYREIIDLNLNEAGGLWIKLISPSIRFFQQSLAACGWQPQILWIHSA